MLELAAWEHLGMGRTWALLVVGGQEGRGQALERGPQVIEYLETEAVIDLLGAPGPQQPLLSAEALLRAWTVGAWTLPAPGACRKARIASAGPGPGRLGPFVVGLLEALLRAWTVGAWPC